VSFKDRALDDGFSPENIFSSQGKFINAFKKLSILWREQFEEIQKLSQSDLVRGEEKARKLLESISPIKDKDKSWTSHDIYQVL